jgi:signal transduction histidine kinase
MVTKVPAADVAKAAERETAEQTASAEPAPPSTPPVLDAARDLPVVHGGAPPGSPGADAASEELARLREHIAQSAHDMSNALGAVLNYCTFLGEDLATCEAAQEYLPHLQNAVRRALNLVDQLGELPR